MDIPLLIEIGWDKKCDKLIFVDTPENIRIQRFAKRNEYSIEEAHSQLKKRESRQIPLEQKKNISDWIINNQKDDLTELQNQCEIIWSQLNAIN